MREADLVGALLLAAALAGVILAFATADARVQVFAPQGRWYLLGAVVATGALVWHVRTAEHPLVPRGALGRTPAWGALLVSFFVGAALVAALIDIPIFARTTVDQGSQVSAALVLVRFLVALPIGAVAGGYLTRWLPAGVVAAVGMALATLGFVLMSGWDVATLSHASANVALLVGGSRLRPRAGAGQRGRAGQHRPRRCTGWPAQESWSRGWWGCWSASRR